MTWAVGRGEIPLGDEVGDTSCRERRRAGGGGMKGGGVCGTGG